MSYFKCNRITLNNLIVKEFVNRVTGFFVAVDKNYVGPSLIDHLLLKSIVITIMFLERFRGTSSRRTRIQVADSHTRERSRPVQVQGVRGEVYTSV